MKSIGQLLVFLYLFATLVDCENTTTTDVPTTTENVTVTEPPAVANDTTVDPTPTTPAPTTTTPSPIGNWTLENENGTCIMLLMDATFYVTYNVTNGTAVSVVHLDPSAKVVEKESNCSKGVLMIEVGKGTLTLEFAQHDNKVDLVNITLQVVFDSETYPNATDKKHTYSATGQSLFEAPVGKSYLCNKEQDIKLSDDTKIQAKNLRVEAFVEKKDSEFSPELECDADDGDVSGVVPIAVGCALAGLVVIVLIAYLVGRRHKRQKGYESV